MRKVRLSRALTCSAALAVAVTTSATVAVPAEASSSITLGASGDVAGLSQHIGAPLATHEYAQFSNKVPAADMITVTANASWRTVASAGPGSSLYNSIAGWARTIKARNAPVLMAFHHEPEAAGSSHLGTPADYIAADRHVVSIFRSQGATNVRWVWQMTGYAFRARPSDRRYAANWYPGDAYVDVVGADVYNWSHCYGHNDPWTSLASLTGPVLSFARAHGKQASFPEWGSANDSRRAQWLTDARTFMSSNTNVVSSAFYFNRADPSPQRAGTSCTWALNQSSEYQAFGDMARSSSFRS
jgi:hypothetical protein